MSDIELRFPHIAKALLQLWGTSALSAYIANLIMTDRFDREGFTFNDVKDFTLLESIHKEVFPELYSNDQWEKLFGR